MVTISIDMLTNTLQVLSVFMKVVGIKARINARLLLFHLEVIIHRLTSSLLGEHK